MAKQMVLEEFRCEQGPRPFVVKIDHEREIITIQGVNYAFGLFDQIGFAAKGSRFEIGERSDGVVTLHALPREAA